MEMDKPLTRIVEGVKLTSGKGVPSRWTVLWYAPDPRFGFVHCGDWDEPNGWKVLDLDDPDPYDDETDLFPTLESAVKHMVHWQLGKREPVQMHMYVFPVPENGFRHGECDFCFREATWSHGAFSAGPGEAYGSNDPAEKYLACDKHVGLLNKARENWWGAVKVVKATS